MITSNGLEEIRDALDGFLERGGRAWLLVGTDMASDPAAIRTLMRMADRHDSFSLKCSRSGARRIFHPKVSIFGFARRKPVAIVGSSNLTAGGLTDNYEANLLTDSSSDIERLRDYFEECYEGGYAIKVTEEWLKRYEALWRKRRRWEPRIRDVRDRTRNIVSRAPRRTEEKPAPGRIAGHVFAFTGKIPDHPRERRLYPAVIKLGGNVVKRPEGMRNADCLVQGEFPGGRRATLKIRAARENGVPIIPEEMFMKMLRRERAGAGR